MRNKGKLKKKYCYPLLIIGTAIAILIIAALTPTKWSYDPKPDCNVNIYVVNGGVHTDIIVPVKTKFFDWNQHISLQEIGIDTQQDYNYLSFGWGERDFFINTPTVADINILTVSKALFYPHNTSVMYVQGYQNVPQSKNIHCVRVSYSDFLKMMIFINTSFQMDENYKKIRVANGYRENGGFYTAIGNYSILNNCNNWTATALREADVNAPLWSGLSSAIALHLKSNCKCTY